MLPGGITCWVRVVCVSLVGIVLNSMGHILADLHPGITVRPRICKMQAPRVHTVHGPWSGWCMQEGAAAL